MAELTHPTSWNSGGMDWGNPDSTNRLYLDAILLAIQERFINLDNSGIWRAFPVELRPGLILSVESADVIITLINRLLSEYVVENPDEVARISTPFVTAYSTIHSDPQLKFFSVGGGVLLRDSRSAEFLKACKHFLDLCLIAPCTPEFLADIWSWNYESEGIESWVELWNDYMAAGHHDIVADQPVSGFDASFNHLSLIGNTRFEFNANLRYLPHSPLAHKLIVLFAGDSDPTEVYPPLFYRAWDYTNSEFVIGSINEISVSSGSNVVQIGDEQPVSPASFVAWNTEEENVPHSGNTSYICRSIGHWINFGVNGGFNFQP